MCGPQIKKYFDIDTSSSLNIKETCTRKEQEDLHALEDRSEKLSESLLYTCNVAAEAKQSTEVTNSHKRTLEDDSSLQRIDLQSESSRNSRPKRAKRAKRNVYSPSSSNESDEKVEKPSTKKRAGRKKKRKGAPSRPLSAYNFFFKQERMRLINLSSDHPKIGFSSMGKIIGTNWKSMSEEAKAPYKALADKDHERYARELEIFEEKERMAAGTYDDTFVTVPLLTTTSTDTFKTQEETVYEEPYSSSSTSSTKSTSTTPQQEDLQHQEATTSNYDAFQDILIQDIEPIPLNEVWKPNNYGYKAFQNEALYGYVNFGDFLNN